MALGGLYGLVAVISLFPVTNSLIGLLMVLGLGTAIAAWLSTGAKRFRMLANGTCALHDRSHELTFCKNQRLIEACGMVVQNASTLKKDF
jgi:hypothetical protein